MSIAGLWHVFPLWLPGLQPARWLWLVAYICIHMCVFMHIPAQVRRLDCQTAARPCAAPIELHSETSRASRRANAAFSANAFVSGRSAPGGMASCPARAQRDPGPTYIEDAPMAWARTRGLDLLSGASGVRWAQPLRRFGICFGFRRRGMGGSYEAS
jgi:hypothetical protein